MADKIDRDRGAHIRIHRSGIRVVQYVDDPGTYFDAQGGIVPDALARSAGFDVAADKREKAKRQALAGFKTQLDAQYEEAKATFAETFESGGLKAEPIGDTGKYHIVASNGARISIVPLSKEEAQDLLGLAGDPADGAMAD